MVVPAAFTNQSDIQLMDAQTETEKLKSTVMTLRAMITMKDSKINTLLESNLGLTQQINDLKRKLREVANG